MQYSDREVKSLHLLSENEELSKRFAVPADLNIMTWIVLLVIALAITGAILFKVDKIVPAQGVLETHARLFDVRNAQGGFVDTIAVREGDTVKQGDLLLRLDTEQAEYEIARLEQEQATLARGVWTEYYQIAAFLPDTTRAVIEQSIGDIPDLVSAVGYVEYLSQSLPSRLQMMDQTLAATEGRILSSAQQLAIMDRTLAMEGDELSRLQRLVTQGIENRQQLDQQRKRLLELEAQKASLQSALSSDERELTRLQVEQQEQRNGSVLAGLLALQELRDQYRQTSLMLAAQQRSYRDMTVLAPIDAIVDAIQVRGEREVLEQGATLMQLRPQFSREDLEIDIQIPSNYAVWVEPGMTFRASSLGNNPDDHGYIHGYVSFVSESTEEVNGQRVYRMKGVITDINLSERADRLGAAETFLRPGLQLSVEVKTGQRRLINYLFDPFTKYLRTAMSEPS